jgi:signal transduction histidine kinase
VVPDVTLALVELAVIGYPLYDSWTLDETEQRVAMQAAPLAVLLGGLVWYLALRAWLMPLTRAARRRLAGEVLDGATREAAYEAILALPTRAFFLRVALFGACGACIALMVHLRAGFPLENVGTVFAICTAHGAGVSIFRSIWYASVLESARAAVLPDLDPLRLFADSYRRSLVGAAMATGTLGLLAIGTFTWYFIPINLEHYLRLETFFPITIAILSGLWLLYFRRLLPPIDRYLEAALAPRPADQPQRDDPRAIAAHRAAQSLPYRMALSKMGFWVIGEALLVIECVLFFNVDFESAAMIGGEAFVVTLGVALYEALWVRALLRPLLTHLSARHRPPPEQIRTPLSLRSKMLAGFGAVSVIACGLSLFWSFMQYKTLATVFIQRESELRLDAVLADLTDVANKNGGELPRSAILARLKASATQFAPATSVHDHAVLYYLPPEADAHPIAVGGGDAGPPAMPWAGEALLRRLDRGRMELSSLHLTGAYARLYLSPLKKDAGAIALLLPNYRGRGPSTVPQIRVLVEFFVVLLIASMALVILMARDLTAPVRELQRKADLMARGDLTRPVTSSGEGDEVGRLTFAFEEMRRALNDKLRSSTEINLSLEAEVTRRTAELERRNKELADALEQLQHAQDELVRSEKMASMGRLVAGIAHEINNPVNAVVNTAGPLETTLDELKGDAQSIADVKEMIAVIQRGANRTKEIVQALHNYSRGDDERLVELDLQRSIDETLDLLRHQLKNGITVERHYGDVGRVRGRTALNQVFMNLITNAAQAVAEKHENGGGRIDITAERKNGQVLITVADNGPGIPPDVLPRIFDPFFTTKDVGQGSGLGLSIVHGIVERHGGTISVDSEVGKGTRFQVSLPVDMNPSSPVR